MEDGEDLSVANFEGVHNFYLFCTRESRVCLASWVQLR